MKELLEKLKNGETSVDEVLGKIEEGKKDMVPRARLNEKSEEIKELKAEIENRDKQISSLEQAAKGNEDLEKQIQDLKADNEGWAQKYQQSQIDTAIKLAAKDARDPGDVLAFIQKDELKLEEDGTVKGLDDALKGLRESKPYLFAAEEKPQLKGRTPNPETQQPPQQNDLNKQYEKALNEGNTALAIALKNQMFNEDKE